jgi:protein SCO1
MRLLLCACALLIVGCQQPPARDVYGAAPRFALTDQTGSAFDSQSLDGRVALMDFIYTHCTDACPLLSATFQQAQRKLADAGLATKVTLVSISVDPDHDTPAVLAEYGQQFKADAASWKFLTGDWDAVFDVLTGLKLAVKPTRPLAGAPAPGGTELTHTTRIVLVDPRGQVRGYLEGQDATGDDLVQAARSVLK